jgi:hypothetical protein
MKRQAGFGPRLKIPQAAPISFPSINARTLNLIEHQNRHLEAETESCKRIGYGTLGKYVEDWRTRIILRVYFVSFNENLIFLPIPHF